MAQQRLFGLSVPEMNGTLVVKREKEEGEDLNIPCPIHGRNERKTKAIGQMSHTGDSINSVKSEPVCEDNDPGINEGKEKTQEKSNDFLPGENDANGVVFTCPNQTQDVCMRMRRITVRYDEDSDDNDDDSEGGYGDHEMVEKRRRHKRKSYVRKTKAKTYHCTECDKTLRTAREYGIHQKSHERKNLYQCPKCSQFFSYRNEQETRKNRKSHTCPYCEETYKDLVDFRTKMRAYTPRDSYECPECKKSFTDKMVMVKHAWRHSNIKQVQCTVCDKTFADKNHLEIHMRTHTGEKAYQCTLCDKSLSSKQGLDIHIVSHSGEKPYQCEQCGKSFTTKQGCQLHTDRHNGVKKPRKPCQCPVCDKWVKRKDKLKEHMRVHTGEKPYKCNLCEKSYKSYHALYTHKFTHSNERRNCCPYCGKSFSQKPVLNKHILIHTGEKPHKCEYCNKGFSQKPHLQKHIRLSCLLKSLLPGTQVFSCEKCGTKFIDQTKLHKHQEQHNKEAETAQIDVNGPANSFAYVSALMKPFCFSQNLSNEHNINKAIKQQVYQNNDCSFPEKGNLVNVTNEVSKATEALIYCGDVDADVACDDDFNVNDLFPREEDWINSTEAFDLRTFKPKDGDLEKKKRNDTLEHNPFNLWTSIKEPTDLSMSSKTFKNVTGTQTMQIETEILTQREMRVDEDSFNQNAPDHRMEIKTAESVETCEEVRYESDVNVGWDGYDSDTAIDWDPETGCAEKSNEFAEVKSNDESNNVQNESKFGESNTKCAEHRKKKKQKESKTKSKAVETVRGEPINEKYTERRKISRSVNKVECKNNAEESEPDSDIYEGSTDDDTDITDTDEKPVKPQRINRENPCTQRSLYFTSARNANSFSRTNTTKKNWSSIIALTVKLSLRTWSILGQKFETKTKKTSTGAQYA